MPSHPKSPCRPKPRPGPTSACVPPGCDPNNLPDQGPRMPDANGYAALWDVDGTLVDTAELHFQAWLELCRELGRPFTRADFAATFGRRNPEILEYLFGPRFSAT